MKTKFVANAQADFHANLNSPIENQQLEKALSRKSSAWLFTYVSLFTALLAFFLFVISLFEMEGSTPKRNYQKLNVALYHDVMHLKETQQLYWLQVENTLSKGVRLTFNRDQIPNVAMFQSARARVNPRYRPYISELGSLIRKVQLETFPERHKKMIRIIEAAGFDFKITVRVEGHTDARPLAATALFRNNIELSTYRAYAIKHLLKLYTGLPDPYFSIAGYGGTRPLLNNADADLNRRVVVFLLPQMLNRPVKDHRLAATIQQEAAYDS